jgi:molecular chaperone GrpE
MEPTIESLEQELKSEHGLYLRALADFENYRRRVDRERADFGREALRKFMLPLLDIVDDLDRFVSFAETQTSALIDAVRSIHQKLLKLLDSEGVRPFDSLGTQPAGENAQGTIGQEVQRGYRWGDEVLRAARVVVAV